MAQSAERRSPGRWFVEGGWYFLVVLVSVGILSPIPFAHAASRVRRPLAWLWPALYAAVVVGILLSLGPPGDEARSTAGGLMLFGLTVVALTHLVWVRRQAWPRGEDAPDPAVAAAMAARARREEARAIVGRDPALARELRIGRPDLPRTYDDGGLVDLAGAPAATIAGCCDIGPDIARRIVEVREAQPLTAVDDVFTFSDIPVTLWDRIRDRAVVVP